MESDYQLFIAKHGIFKGRVHRQKSYVMVFVDGDGYSQKENNMNPKLARMILSMTFLMMASVLMVLKFTGG